ncbi:MAG TPA: TIGR03435 family protein [Vicinamibacterales bacterium]|jgi:uncharacterized protein (TIGR03435 family)|nr:TIGR03435 family protein [Vicinamibacterales bacterium]
MTGASRLAVASLLAGRLVAAQDARFDVASLKRNTSGSTSTSMSDRPDGLMMENGTLRNLIFNAYRPQSNELVGAPGWLADRYDLIAKAGGPATAELRAAMLRALLEERLHLQAHYEMREQPVYELVFARRDRSLGLQIVRTDRDCAAAAAARDAGRPAPALSPASNGAPPCGVRANRGEFLAGGITMEGLARNLASRAGRVIFDRTGLEGYYQITLTFAPDVAAAVSDAPTLFTALQEQLGLKLEPSRAPLQTLVIDHVERPIER